MLSTCSMRDTLNDTAVPSTFDIKARGWTFHTGHAASSAAQKANIHNELLSLFQKPVNISTLGLQAPSHRPLWRNPMSLPPPTARGHLHPPAIQRFSVTSQFGAKPVRDGNYKSVGKNVSKYEDNMFSGATVKKALVPEDLSIAKLALKLEQNAVIRDQAVEQAKLLQLPKGYPMGGEIKPTEHIESHKAVRAHVKRKRAESALPKPWASSECFEFYGFKPQELNEKGAIALRDCRLSNLYNDIHPLLGSDRFDDTPDAIYDALKPALRLASLFLSQPACMQFWVTLAFGERIDDPEMSQIHGQRCRRIRSHVKLTEERASTIICHLHDLGKKGLIHFTFRQDLLHTRLWGCSAPIYEYRHQELTKSVIRLHSDHYVVAQKLRTLRYPELSQQLRFFFQFAVLLVHELAHSIEGAFVKLRHNEWDELQRTKVYIEPFFFDWRRSPECGKAWEQVTFGGEIQPINYRADGSHGLGFSDWPPRSSFLDPDRRTWYSVSMSYIERLFQVSTWNKKGVRSLSDLNWLHIPRTGAVSLYINTFTTMQWSENKRIALEEAIDEMEVNKARPASKKRVVHSGQIEENRVTEQKILNDILQRLPKGAQKSVGNHASQQQETHVSPDSRSIQNTVADVLITELGDRTQSSPSTLTDNDCPVSSNKSSTLQPEPVVYTSYQGTTILSHSPPNLQYPSQELLWRRQDYTETSVTSTISTSSTQAPSNKPLTTEELLFLWRRRELQSRPQIEKSKRPRGVWVNRKRRVETRKSELGEKKTGQIDMDCSAPEAENPRLTR